MTTNISPATGDIIGQSPEQTPDDVRTGVERARSAQQVWSARSFQERARHVLAIRDYLVANAERITEIIARDNGKTRVDALSTEVFPAALATTYYAHNAQRVLRRRRVRPGALMLANKRSYVDRVPFGVVGIISPWNYPFAIPFHEIIMALMAGNGVVLKAATQTQEVAKAIVQCIEAGNLPSGLFSAFNIPGSAAGDAFIDAGINKLFFTGSIAVGKELMGKCAAKLIPVSLELGGNDAMIVCADANIHRAAAGAAWAGFSNCGQSCAGVERIYVQREVYDPFLRHLRTMTQHLRYGADTAFNVDLGAINNEKQLATITEHVRDALAKGATVGAVSHHCSGSPKGLFYPPTVLEDVSDDMITMREETFGPVVAVQAVDSIEEAIRRANNSHLGLTASVWTTNKATARRIAAQLETGTVSINDHLMSHGLAETPWGGFKQSGIGRTHGTLGLEEMTQPRCVVDDIMPYVQRNMWWYPHGRSVYEGLLGACTVCFGRGLRRRLVGLFRLMRLFPRTFTRSWSA